jgi:hypothetical protein
VNFSHGDTRLSWPGVVFVAVLFAAFGAFAQTPKLKTNFTLDLPKQSRDGSFRGPNALEFVNPRQLAVWYTEKNSEGKLSRRDKLDQGDPWRLKMLLVDAGDGSIKQHLQWPTRKDSSAFVVQSGGTPVLLTGPVIHCFSPEFRETRSFTLKNASKPKELRMLHAAPGGSVVWAIEVSDIATATRIDANCNPGWTLSERRSAPHLSGNDDSLVEANPKQIGIWSHIEGWKLLYQQECCIESSRFVAPGLVAFIPLDLELRRHFTLINLQGQLLLDDPMEQGYEFGGFITAADARTAAALVIQRDIAATATGIEIHKTHAKVRFYDLEARKRIASLDVSVPGENLFGLAIASDSSGFAVLNGTKLSLYELRH